MIRTRTAIVIMIVSCLFCGGIGFFTGMMATQTHITNALTEDRIAEMTIIPPDVPISVYREQN